MRIFLSQSELVVQFRGEANTTKRLLLPIIDSRTVINIKAHSCVSCGQTQCHYEAAGKFSANEKTAWLLTEWWPEFSRIPVEEQAHLFAPIDGFRFKKPNYKFPVKRFATHRLATLDTLVQSAVRRGLPNNGAGHQQHLLNQAEHQAGIYSRWLEPEMSRLVISLNLLAFLWRSGILGGRSFEVIMTRDSMVNIQSDLDEAARKHPERSLLGDFRADPRLVQAETEALLAADRIWTPHLQIAARFPNSTLIPWRKPEPLPWTPGNAIAFPGPTIARKGAYEVREAARKLGLTVVLLGPELEGPNFWAGISTRRVSRNTNWLDGVAVVVLPAIVENRPRLLLQAIASGCPVIATEACGLPNVQSIEPSHVGQLINSLDIYPHDSL